MASTPIHKQIDKVNNTDNTDGSVKVPTSTQIANKNMLQRDFNTIGDRGAKDPWSYSDQDRDLQDQQISRIEKFNRDYPD